MTARVRICQASLAAVPIRGEIATRMLRVRGAIHRAEAAGDTAAADSARVALLTLGALLGRLAATMERHRDLHPHETESAIELAALRGALEPGYTATFEIAPGSASAAVDSEL